MLKDKNRTYINLKVILINKNGTMGFNREYNNTIRRSIIPSWSKVLTIVS
ncbi:MAG: hypothetical protein WCF28_08650 [Methanobacterium sp.]